MSARRQVLRSAASSLSLIALLSAAPEPCRAAERASTASTERPAGGWQVVDGAPRWRSGVPPRPHRDGAIFELASGESTTLEPGGALAVAASTEAGSALDGLEARWSMDGRLFVRAELQRRGDSLAMLRLPPSGARFVRLRAASSATSIRLFLWRATADRGGRLETLPSSRPPIDLQMSELAAADERYWSLEPDSSDQVQVGGLRRVRVDSRLRFTTADGDRRASYRLVVVSDTGERWTLEHTTVAWTQPARARDGRRIAVGELRSGVIDLPAGTRSLRVEATAPVLFRLRAALAESLLLPELNVAAATGLQADVQPGRALHDLDAGEVAYGGSGGLPSRLLAGRWLSRDNRYRRSAEQLVTRARALPIAASDQERATWRRLVDDATSYRNLLPQTKAGRGEIRYRHYLPLGWPQGDGVPETRFFYRELLQEAVGDVGAAYFVDAGTSFAAAHRYALPAGGVPTSLRILVRGTPGTVIRAATPGRDPIELELAVEPVDTSGDGPSTAEVSIALLAADGVPLTRALPGEFVDDVARASIEVPAAARELRVWADRGRAEIAVQRFAGRRFRLAESEYLHWLDSLAAARTPAALFRLLTSPEPPTSSDPDEQLAVRALWNHWLPLARRLRNRRELLAAGLEPFSGSDPACELPHTGEPFEVVTAWGRRARRCHLDAAALERVTDALRRVDRPGIAEGLLAQGLLFGDEPTRRSALAAYAADRRSTGDVGAVLTAAAAAALGGADEHSLVSLIDVLLEDGSSEAAVWIGSLLQIEDRALNERLAAGAFELRWWRLFGRFMAGLEPQDRNVWRRRRSLAQGRPDPGPGEAPGLEPRWRDANWMVRDAAGAEEVLLAHAKSPIRFLRASPERPVRLRVPAWVSKLRIEARPIVEPDRERAPEIWLTARHSGREKRLPLRAHPVTPALTLESPRLDAAGPSRRLATRGRLELDLGSAAEEVGLYTAGGVVVLRFEALGQPPPSLAALEPVPSASVAQADPGALCIADVGGRETVTCFDRLTVRRGVERQRPSLDGDAASGQPAGDPRADRFEELVRLAEEGSPEDRGRALVAAEALFASAGHAPGLRSAYDRATHGAGWRRLTSVQSSAGIRRIERQSWPPEDPQIRVSRALLGELAAADLVVSGSRRLSFELGNRSRVELRVSLELRTLPPYRPLPLGAVWQLDEEEPRIETLDDGQPRRIVRLTVPAGDHRLSVWISEPRFRHYLVVRVEEAKGPQSGSDLSFEPLQRSLQRDYDVATAGEPLRLRVRGPAWLRVDELRGEETVTRYEHVDSEGWQSLEIPPPAGSEQALYRLFERTVGEPPEVLAPARRAVAPTRVRTLGSTLAVAEVELPALGPTELGGLGLGGTHSLSVGAYQRRLIEEEVAAADESEEFQQLDWEYRRGRRGLDDDRRYLEIGLLGRTRDAGEATVGGSALVRFEPSESRWAFQLSAAGYVQQVDSSEWSATVRGSLGRSFRHGESLSSRLQLSGFARELSLGGEMAAGRLAEIDQDVFTRYKDDHRAGLRLAHSLSYALYADMQLWSELSARSNESPGDIERAEVQVGLRQLVGDLRFDLRYRFARFFQDDDRSADFDRERVTLRAFWERWTVHAGRWEFGGALSYDVRGSELSGSLSLSRHFSGGRALEDFRPEAAGFQRLRTLRSGVATQP